MYTSCPGIHTSLYMGTDDTHVTAPRAIVSGELGRASAHAKTGRDEKRARALAALATLEEDIGNRGIPTVDVPSNWPRETILKIICIADICVGAPGLMFDYWAELLSCLGNSSSTTSRNQKRKGERDALI